MISISKKYRTHDDDRPELIMMFAMWGLTLSVWSESREEGVAMGGDAERSKYPSLALTEAGELKREDAV